jgi:hypothetical protein
LYLSGKAAPELRGSAIGLMVQPRSGLVHQIEHYRSWAADTGCYTETSNRPFLTWPWFAWLRALPHQDRCVFATAPDVLGDMRATLWRSEAWLPAIRALGYPAALVAQDGAEDVDLPWHCFDVLFVGGTTKWKLSSAASAVAAEAKRRDKLVHMGRVNSLRRIRAAALMGCASVDGTFLAYRARANGQTPRSARGLVELSNWLARLESEPFLPLSI